MSLITPLAYFLLPPHSSSFLYAVTPTVYEDTLSPPPALSAQPYTPIALDEEGDGEEEGTHAPGPKRGVALNANDNAAQLLICGCAEKYHWLLSKIIHSVRDYYPLWQLVYQTTVFLSRSSISLGIPALPQSILPLPAIIQAIILLVLTYESAVGFFDDNDEVWSVFLVFILISLEGICGGLAYVNAFYRVNHEPPDPNTHNNIERTRQERESRIGSIGFADSTGILFASIFAVPTELELCKAQVRRGKLLCKGL
ncbi:hypothetical protein K443DRAFT_2599 [Laccaria amethystina LaAM-08-1]|uniref:Protein BTN n=1 Tax=Laccaria amethystina LaAM-08-1 TaxID=1095629 RepID=A0A0C9YGG5_9AGAR|nr:hypothetical protein K443DRAFT_2599 [Laccaria amethystina LaAM-08-1]